MLSKQKGVVTYLLIVSGPDFFTALCYIGWKGSFAGVVDVVHDIDL